MADIKSIIAEIKQPLWHNWYITGEVGSGASSVVYRIEAKRENRTDVSALKVEPITLDDVLYLDDKKKADYLEKKRQAAVNETGIMYKLRKCPYIVGYEDEDIRKLENTEGYVLLIRMEYLECLQTQVKEGRFDRSESNVLKLAYEIGSGIKAAHDIGVIHRDVKPANFFVSAEDGTYKLGDFNISKTSASARSFAGTEGYIAPEIYRAKRSVENVYTKQADIYSFGICLYQLMNDYCFPFEDNCLADEAIDRRMSGEPLPVPKNASQEFGRIILKACAYELNDRYTTIDEMLADISALRYSGAASVQQSYNASGINNPFVQNSMNQGSFNNGSLNNPFNQNSMNQGSFSKGSSVRRDSLRNNPSDYGTAYADDTVYSNGDINIDVPVSVHEEKPPKKKSILPVVLIPITALLIGGGAAGAFIFFGKDKDDKKAASHPEDAVEYDGHYYKFFDKALSWKDAEAYCVEQGGHLASVNSKGEQNFLVNLTENEPVDNIWIGGYRLQDDKDTWYWTDGSDFDYTNWDSWENYDGDIMSQPDNYLEQEYYIRYSNDDFDYFDWYANKGGWIDTRNNGDSDAPVDYYGFVCEWE